MRVRATSGLLSCSVPAAGYDLQASNISGSKERGVDISYLDVVAQPDRVKWADLVVVTEMLEHLVDPHGFVETISAQPQVSFLVASSPYTETDESHYGFHTWAWDLEGYARLFTSRGWRLVKQEQIWISQTLLLDR